MRRIVNVMLAVLAAVINVFHVPITPILSVPGPGPAQQGTSPSAAPLSALSHAPLDPSGRAARMNCLSVNAEHLAPLANPFAERAAIHPWLLDQSQREVHVPITPILSVPGPGPAQQGTSPSAAPPARPAQWPAPGTIPSPRAARQSSPACPIATAHSQFPPPYRHRSGCVPMAQRCRLGVVKGGHNEWNVRATDRH